MSAQDDYKIALNILARVGINSPDFVKEYSKAKATLHQFNSMNEMQAQDVVPPMPSQVSPQGMQPPMETMQGGGEMPPSEQMGKYDNL